MSWQDNDIYKGKSHKYIKREGTPGNYTYFYYDPATGQLKAGDDQEHGKKDHARRLIASRAAGHHAMDNDKIANEVGVTAKRIREHISNLTQAGRRKNPTAESPIQHAHDYEEHHLHEGHKDLAHPDYDSHVHASKEEARGETPTAPSTRGGSRPRREAPTERHEIPADAPAPSREAARPAPSAASSPARHEVSDAEKTKLRSAGFMKQTDGSFMKHHTGGMVRIKKDHIDGKWSVSGHDSDGGESGGPGHSKLSEALESARSHGEAVESSHARRREEQAREEATPEPTPAPRARRARAAAPTTTPAEREQEQRAVAATTPARTGPSAEALARARARLAAPAPTSPAPEVRQQAEAAVARVVARQAQEAMRESSPVSPASRELGETDPGFAASEATINSMLEVQRTGGNPYITRARDIFHNIRGDLKAERKAVCDHVFAALDAMKSSGTPVNEANLVAKYKELSGKRIRGISGIAEDFEKGTFMTMDEVLNNHPVNVEVERMKRGYAAKQFARCKPFLKESFTTANPSAPPPYPTFGDMKTWTEHGGAKPSWAGTTRTAVPKELHDAAIKGADGKPQYPPSWMPLHLMPVWNYAAKKSLAEGNNPYQTAAVGTDQQGRVSAANTGTQAEYQEGMMKSAIRKYVVMRGGEGGKNLVDIPASKLSEAGLSHADVFKSEEESGDMSHILSTKIVDPVGLMKFVKEEMKGQTKKSWALVVDLEMPTMDFRKSFIVHSDMKKSKIERVKELIREKTRS
jgi:hypothetical protein